MAKKVYGCAVVMAIGTASSMGVKQLIMGVVEDLEM
jgi:hypothetical protein